MFDTILLAKITVGATVASSSWCVRRTQCAHFLSAVVPTDPQKSAPICAH